jgi:serine/threonine protein kinase
MSDTVIIPGDKKNDVDFGKYQFISELGGGAMGTVYKCFDPDFHRMVAVKTIHNSLLVESGSEEFRERFRNEMRAAGKVTHPNIVSVFDAGEKDNSPFYVMEMVEGQDLKAILDEKKQLTLKESLSIVKGVLSGLSSIHKNGITHRDLKPANIFVSNEGVAKIADFGIAKLDSSELTQIGTIIGSPKYMSPEQCIGEPVDARSDLFAAGIILYELITGTYCFKSDSASAMTQKIMNAEIIPPSKIGTKLPKYLDKVLKKALSKKADDRFQNAVEFLKALDSEKNKIKTRNKNLIVATAFTASLVVAAIIAFGFFSSTPISPKKTVNNIESSQIDRPNKIVERPLSSINREIESLSPAKSAKIEKLLKVAETYKRIGRLVSPAGSNAFDAYKIILSIDPQNQKALVGLELTRDAMIEKAKEFRDTGEIGQAIAVAKAGQEVFPNSTVFTDMLKNVNSRAD